jgi:hypothetical protein
MICCNFAVYLITETRPLPQRNGYIYPPMVGSSVRGGPIPSFEVKGQRKHYFPWSHVSALRVSKQCARVLWRWDLCFRVCKAEAASWFVVFGSLMESANVVNGARRGFADFRQIRGNC